MDRHAGEGALPQLTSAPRLCADSTVARDAARRRKGPVAFGLMPAAQRLERPAETGGQCAHELVGAAIRTGAPGSDEAPVVRPGSVGLKVSDVSAKILQSSSTMETSYSCRERAQASFGQRSGAARIPSRHGGAVRPVTSSARPLRRPYADPVSSPGAAGLVGSLPVVSRGASSPSASTRNARCAWMLPAGADPPNGRQRTYSSGTPS